MKINKRNQSIARKIFKISLDNNKLNENRLQKFVTLLIKDKTVESKQILIALTKLIEHLEASNKLIVQSAFDMADYQKADIKRYFENQLSKKLDLQFQVNKDLIGGIKIINSDFQWENSIISNLQKMKGAV